MQCVQLGRLKYIRDALGAEQLFDLETDSEERTNLTETPAYADELERMRQQVRAVNPDRAISPWPTVPSLDE